MVFDDILQKARKIWDDLTPEQQRTVGLLGGLLVGTKICDIYQNCTPEQQQCWRELRPFHHGDFGFSLKEEGEKRRNPFQIGLGEGLMQSDIEDIQEWDYAKSKKYKMKKRK